MTPSKANTSWKLAGGALVVAGIFACILLMTGCACSSNDADLQNGSSSESASSQSSSSTSDQSASQSLQSSSTNYTTTVDASDPYGTGIHHAIMTIEGYEPVTIELNANEAPVTVANFAKLANEGFYNGLNFYRFVDGFCMQGGSSNNSAMPANDGLTPIVGEFSGNNRANTLADNFKKGTVAMARNSNPNSAGSTFFVTLSSGASVEGSLNGQYAAFGTIDNAGMAIIDQVVADYLPNVTDTQMGSIDDESKQAKIASITMLD